MLQRRSPILERELLPPTGMLADLHYGLRLLKRSPGTTVIATLTLAIGIGATTTTFSWIDSILLNPYGGVGEPHRVVALETLAPSGEHLTTSYLDFRDLRDNTRLLDGIALYQPRPVNLGDELNAERVWVELVSGNYFDLLRVKPELGRFFSGAEQDDAQGAHPVAVISHTLWKTRFQSSPKIVGSVIRVNRFPYTVIGVAPERFHGSMAGLAFDLWLPATMFGQVTSTGNWMLRDRKTRMFLALARLKPGVSLDQGRLELAAIARRMAEADAYTNHGIGFTLLPRSEGSFGAEKILGKPLPILLAVCGVVLLIGCANVANLLLARATSRGKEFSVRVALGAERARLVRQLLTETLLLALAGSVFGLLIASWSRDSLIWLLPTTGFVMLRPPINLNVLAFTEALAVAMTLVCGLAPAFHAARTDISSTLKESGRSDGAGGASNRLRGLLVVSEVALAVIALVGAGLFLRSFSISRTIHPGFDPNHVVVGEFDLTTARYDRAQAVSFSRRLRDRLDAAPGITAVSYADSIPLGFHGGSWEDLDVEGYVPGPSENMKIYRNLVAPGYFNLMRIPLVEGRDFTDHDDETSLRVMIVNQEFVRRFYAGRSPVGRKVRGWGQWFTVVGIARDSKYHSLTESPAPFFYIPIRQVFRPEMGLAFHVRASLAPDQAIGLLRREARAIDPNVALFDAMPMSEHVAASLYGQKIAATLLAVLGAMALLLASIGLYGVMSYSMTQRTHEIGIRMALGAQPRDVLRMVVIEGMTVTALGLLAGAAAAFALARLASRTLILVSPSDPLTYAAVAAFLLAVALLACWLPARRAMRVDPLIALRYQ
jgi:predicted permease